MSSVFGLLCTKKDPDTKSVFRDLSRKRALDLVERQKWNYRIKMTQNYHKQVKWIAWRKVERNKVCDNHLVVCFEWIFTKKKIYEQTKRRKKAKSTTNVTTNRKIYSSLRTTFGPAKIKWNLLSVKKIPRFFPCSSEIVAMLLLQEGSFCYRNYFGLQKIRSRVLEWNPTGTSQKAASTTVNCYSKWLSANWSVWQKFLGQYSISWHHIVLHTSNDNPYFQKLRFNVTKNSCVHLILIKHSMHLFNDSFLIRWRIVSSTSEISTSIVINSICGNESDKKKSTGTVNNMTHAIDDALSLEFESFYIHWIIAVASECFQITKKATISRNETNCHHIWIIENDEKTETVNSERWASKNLMWTMARMCNEKCLQFNCNSIQCCSSFGRYYAR